MSLLEVRDLHVSIPSEDGLVQAVRGVSFDVNAGEFFGIVGESGSGKSVLVQSIMGLVGNAQTKGSALFKGEDLLQLTSKELRSIRGREISMIFQDPLSSLHPQYTVGWQIAEQIKAHEKISQKAAMGRAVELLKRVRIPDAKNRSNAYPHQFSGGMRQRVMIAMGLALSPSLIIADEPTTALDSTVQAQVLDLLAEMRSEFGTTVLMISHDLGVMTKVADRVMVMYGGTRVEMGQTQGVLGQPAHPYTAGLLRSSAVGQEPGSPLVPIPGRPPSLLDPPPGCPFRDRCPDAMDICIEKPPVRFFDDGTSISCWLEREPSKVVSQHSTSQAQVQHNDVLVSVEDLTLSFGQKKSTKTVLDGISLELKRGETLGLVGESGCGKTTLARAIAGLIEPSGGSIKFDGKTVGNLSRSEWIEMRKRVQLVFQDPFGSLNPKRRIGSIVGDPLRIHGVASGVDLRVRVNALLEQVGLDPAHANRFPSQFSGGQRQRIGIARALALNPELIILDEPVSALDVSVQAQVLNLLDDLQNELGLSYIFISHDLGVVRHVCDRIAVMENGKIIELGEPAAIYEDPQEEFTKRLLEAATMPVEHKPYQRKMLSLSVQPMPGGAA